MLYILITNFLNVLVINFHPLLFTVKPQSIVSESYIHYTLFIWAFFFNQKRTMHAEI